MAHLRCNGIRIGQGRFRKIFVSDFLVLDVVKTVNIIGTKRNTHGLMNVKQEIPDGSGQAEANRFFVDGHGKSLVDCGVFLWSSVDDAAHIDY